VTTNTLVSSLILMVFGVVSMLRTVLNWRFVTRSGKLLNIALGDTVARVIYFGLGVFLFIKSIETMIGANWI